METILTRSQVSSSTSLYRYRQKETSAFDLAASFSLSLSLSCFCFHISFCSERDKKSAHSLQNKTTSACGLAEHVISTSVFLDTSTTNADALFLFACVHLFTVQSFLSLSLDTCTYTPSLPSCILRTARLLHPGRRETRANSFCTQPRGTCARP